MFLQSGAIDVAKELIYDAIAEMLDIGTLVSTQTFCIADLECSLLGLILLQQLKT